jgi:hypothetical protein
VRRATAVLGVLLLLAALALALMPFRDGAVRCGPPLLGADASLPRAPADGLGLHVAVGCTDDAVGRLMLACVLYLVGIAITAVGLWLGWRPMSDGGRVEPRPQSSKALLRGFRKRARLPEPLIPRLSDREHRTTGREIGRSVSRLLKQSAPSGAANVLANPAQQVFTLGRCGCPNRLEVRHRPAQLHIRVQATAGRIGVEVEERLVP